MLAMLRLLGLLAVWTSASFPAESVLLIVLLLLVPLQNAGSERKKCLPSENVKGVIFSSNQCQWKKLERHYNLRIFCH